MRSFFLFSGSFSGKKNKKKQKKKGTTCFFYDYQEIFEATTVPNSPSNADTFTYVIDRRHHLLPFCRIIKYVEEMKILCTHNLTSTNQIATHKHVPFSCVTPQPSLHNFTKLVGYADADADVHVHMITCFK